MMPNSEGVSSPQPPEDTVTIETAFDDIPPRMSLAQQLFAAWTDMKASTRRLIDSDPSEARLLAFVLMSDLVFVLSWTLKTLVSPLSGAEELIPNEVAALLITGLCLRTACMYSFAAALNLVARVFGSKREFRSTRAALFWGAFVAAPFGLLAAVVTVIIHNFEDSVPLFQADWVALPPYWLGLMPFLWFISQGLAEAHGARRVAPIFLALSLLAIGGIIGAIWLDAAVLH